MAGVLAGTATSPPFSQSVAVTTAGSFSTSISEMAGVLAGTATAPPFSQSVAVTTAGSFSTSIFEMAGVLAGTATLPICLIHDEGLAPKI